MVRYIFILFSVLLVSLSSAFAQEYGVSVDNASARLDALKAANTQIQSIKADFAMTKKVALLADVQHGSGKMMFSKADNRLSLDYVEPKGSSIVIEGDRLYMTTAGKTTTVSAQSNPAMSQMMSMIKSCVTGDFSSLTSKSDVKCFQDDSLFTIVIRPNNARVRRFIKQIVLRFNADNSLNTMRMDEGSGDYTIYTYTNQNIIR